jgi:hypothetical protein
LQEQTAAKIAGATSEIAQANSKADRTIKESLQPDLWGVARRDLLDAVRLRKQEIEDEGRAVSKRDEINLWAELAAGRNKFMGRTGSKRSIQNTRKKTWRINRKS